MPALTSGLQDAIHRGCSTLYAGIEGINKVSAEGWSNKDFDLLKADFTEDMPLNFQPGWKRDFVKSCGKYLNNMSDGMNAIGKAYCGMYMVMTDTLLLSIDVVSNAKQLSGKAIKNMTNELSNVTKACEKLNKQLTKENMKQAVQHAQTSIGKIPAQLTKQTKDIRKSIKKSVQDLNKYFNKRPKEIGWDLLVEQCAKFADTVKNEVTNIPDRTVLNITKLSQNIQNAREKIGNIIKDDIALDQKKTDLIKAKTDLIKAKTDLINDRSAKKSFVKKVKTRRNTQNEKELKNQAPGRG